MDTSNAGDGRDAGGSIREFCTESTDITVTYTLVRQTTPLKLLNDQFANMILQATTLRHNSRRPNNPLRHRPRPSHLPTPSPPRRRHDRLLHPRRPLPHRRNRNRRSTLRPCERHIE